MPEHARSENQTVELVLGFVRRPTTGKEGDTYIVASCDGKVNLAWAEGD